ncbi:hypothetical protein O181_044916 [Austropuccinia psidii MF-1]|uniref:Uncharacterized protein n=1 Tax=Austropuccinia psidii MF-1 TaxID=1389203 RepID=A0A9Q3DJ81_9BASI|nr:hypothetical protein [Austropuccinia psidii MF-1]
MPSTRSGPTYNPSICSQKGYRRDYGRSQSVTEGPGSMNESQTDKLCHSEADNAVLTSNRANTATKSFSGHIQSHTEGLQQRIAAQRLPDSCISVEKLHELLPDCEQVSGPSQHLQVTQWMASIYGKEKYYSFKRRMVQKKLQKQPQKPLAAIPM